MSTRSKEIKLQTFKLGTDLEHCVNAINEYNFHPNYAVIKTDQRQLLKYLLCINEAKIKIQPKCYMISI